MALLRHLDMTSTGNSFSLNPAPRDPTRAGAIPAVIVGFPDRSVHDEPKAVWASAVRAPGEAWPYSPRTSKYPRSFVKTHGNPLAWSQTHSRQSGSTD